MYIYNYYWLQGYASGSFGPTTAGRMDSYVDMFQAAGGSMIMLAKGNRSKQVTIVTHSHYIINLDHLFVVILKPTKLNLYVSIKVFEEICMGSD